MRNEPRTFQCSTSVRNEVRRGSADCHGLPAPARCRQCCKDPSRRRRSRMAARCAAYHLDARGCWQQNGICGSFSGGVGPDGVTPRVMQIQPDDGTDYDAVLNVFAADNLGDTGLLWSASFGPGPTDPLLNVPVVCDGRGNVYAAYNRTLSGFAHDGTRMWTWQSPGEIVAQPAWPSAPTASEPNAGASALADVAIVTYYGGASDGAAPRMHIAAIT